MSLNFNRLRDFNNGSECDTGSASVIILAIRFCGDWLIPREECCLDVSSCLFGGRVAPQPKTAAAEETTSELEQVHS